MHWRFLGFKLKLTRLGSALVDSNKERFMAAGEIFGGIKDIKFLAANRATSVVSRPFAAIRVYPC